MNLKIGEEEPKRQSGWRAQLKGIYDPNIPAELSVVQIFGVDNVTSERLRRDQNGCVPIRNLKSFGMLNCDAHKRVIDRLTGEGAELLNPFNRLRRRKRMLSLSADNGDEELLQDLCRGAELF